jgi:hypothetical protein
MDWWTSLAWSGLVGFLVWQWSITQAQQQTHQRQQHLHRTPEAALPARSAPVQGGKKGKGKHLKGDAAPKGLAGGLDAPRGAEASSSQHASAEANEQVRARGANRNRFQGSPVLFWDCMGPIEHPQLLETKAAAIRTRAARRSLLSRRRPPPTPPPLPPTPPPPGGRRRRAALAG